ncbi:MAG TPA: transporter substrate-binding domain-containing protein, partial [Leptospiraceae bacterium]|nr:transporter substrate-binding domain-containing protein [Leptospiraceae bacterium]HMY67763.1 transporter substrate-binding domain-containing protein [Leptospiraceae bacterium]HMZ62247.1 transporter substrate-binding domain-containing protein [Leptospiraceae bacterium]HNF12834.1 transporter substrate-binding domain-containing protein [Leptospiraceae bacterium]HNF24212.1 transporter substrate-binding domain-containing protein [Leptospiraceae bacterium]
MNSILKCFFFFFVLMLPVSAQDLDRSILGKILKKKELIVSVAANYEPYYIKNPKPGYPGFEVEIAQKYAEFLDVKLTKVVPLNNFTEHAEAVIAGKIDLALGNSMSLVRAKQVYFSEPYVTVSIAGLVNKIILPQEQEGEVLLTKSYRSLLDIKNLARLNIGVKDKTSNADYMRSNFSQFPIQVFPSDTLGLAALNENKVNTYIADNLFLEGQIQKDPSLKSRYLPLLAPVIDKHLCIAFKKYDLQLQTSLNLFVREMKRTGEISRIKDRYFLSNEWVVK